MVRIVVAMNPTRERLSAPNCPSAGERAKVPDEFQNGWALEAEDLRCHRVVQTETGRCVAKPCKRVAQPTVRLKIKPEYKRCQWNRWGLNLGGWGHKRRRGWIVWSAGLHRADFAGWLRKKERRSLYDTGI